MISDDKAQKNHNNKKKPWNKIPFPQKRTINDKKLPAKKNFPSSGNTNNEKKSEIHKWQ